MFLLIYIYIHILFFDDRECWGTQEACSECVVERFCSYDCLHTALRSYHSFDGAGGRVEKGIAVHSFTSLEKMLTDVSAQLYIFGKMENKPIGLIKLLFLHNIVLLIVLFYYLL